jgi:hypothetical protein
MLAYEPHRIDLHQQCRRAERFAGLRIEDVGLAERQIKRMHARGILVEQVPQIGGGDVRGGKGEEHRALREAVRLREVHSLANSRRLANLSDVPADMF